LTRRNWERSTDFGGKKWGGRPWRPTRRGFGATCLCAPRLERGEKEGLVRQKVKGEWGPQGKGRQKTWVKKEG